MPLGEFFYITLGQITLGIGLVALLIITLSTHIITRKEILRSVNKEIEIRDKLDKTELAIKEKLDKVELDKQDIIVKTKMEKLELELKLRIDTIEKEIKHISEKIQGK